MDARQEKPPPAARLVLMSCGSYNPPTHMHLRMFGESSLLRAGHPPAIDRTR